jgi:cold shock CspA family protein
MAPRRGHKPGGAPMIDEDYETTATVATWNGRSGYLLTDCGERIPLHSAKLHAYGFKGPIKVGDRVYLWVSKRAKTVISVGIKRINMVVPAEPDPQKLERLAARNREIMERRNPDGGTSATVDEFTGIIESFDDVKGYGYIRADDGTRIFFHQLALRASGYSVCERRMRIRCEALDRSGNGWHAFRILSLEQTARER